MVFLSDALILLVPVLYALHGWKKGTLRALAGPFSLLTGLIIGFVYLHQSHNLWRATLIMVLCPLILGVILNVSLILWHKKIDKELPSGAGSKLCGACIGTLWGTAMTALVLILLVLLPGPSSSVNALQGHVRRSYFFKIVEHQIINRWPLFKNMEKTLEAARDPQGLQQVQALKEIRALQKDEKFQALLADPGIRRQLEENDIAGLLRNENFRAMLRDEALVEKFLDLYRKLSEEGLWQGP